MERADDGDAVLLVDLLEVAHHRVARGGVEARHRLVREHDLRPLHERTRDPDTLLLAARESIGSPESLVRDPHAAEALERGPDLVAARARRHRAPRRLIAEPAGEGVAEDRAASHEVELLEDHPNAAPDASQLGAARACDHAPARRVHQPVDAAQQRRLPRTRQPDEDDELAAADVEGDSIECSRAARIDLHEILDRKQRVDLASLGTREGRRTDPAAFVHRVPEATGPWSA